MKSEIRNLKSEAGEGLEVLNAVKPQSLEGDLKSLCEKWVGRATRSRGRGTTRRPEGKDARSANERLFTLNAISRSIRRVAGRNKSVACATHCWFIAQALKVASASVIGRGLHFSTCPIASAMKRRERRAPLRRARLCGYVGIVNLRISDSKIDPV